MSFGLSLCLVQVVLPANNVQSHIYASALFMFLITVIMYGSWPWKFDSNNWAELMCKIALIILLMLTTSFVDVNSVSQSERERMNEVWAHIIIFTLIGAFVFTLVLFIQDIVSSMQHVRIKQVRTARAMWHLRDMSLALLMMPEKEYARRLGAMGDSDRALLMEVNKNIKNVIFGQQENSSWLQQRLIAGKQHEVWDHGQRVLGFLRESKSGGLRERLDHSMRFRMRLLDLAKAISRSGSTSAGSLRSTSSSAIHRYRSSIVRHHAEIRDVIQMRASRNRRSSRLVSSSIGLIGWAKSKLFPQAEAELTQDEFKRRISSFPELNMPEEDIDTLFSVLDSNESGTVNYQELTDLLAALAPEKVMRAMGRDDQDDDAAGSEESGGEEETEANEEVPSECGLGSNSVMGRLALQERTTRTWTTTWPPEIAKTGNDQSEEEEIEL
jgi:hypothetical protein